MLLMVTNRRVKNGRYGDEERPNYKFEYQYGYNKRPQGQDGFEKNGKVGFEKALLFELHRIKSELGINTPKVGVYIHGFNNTYQQSIDELYDIEERLSETFGYPPVIVGFSWPSAGKVTRYLADRDEARDSVGAFTRFLLDINSLATRNEHQCFSTTFCIAHSMGNYMLRKGLEYLSDYLGAPQGRMIFDETVMLAPDIADEDIELDRKGKYIAQFSRRVHVYYSKHDRVLKVSSAKRFGRDMLGRHGPDDFGNLAKNVIAINTGKYANSASMQGYKDRGGNDVSVHSAQKYHKDILSDVAQVISSIDRNHIVGRVAYEEDGVLMSNHYELG